MNNLQTLEEKDELCSRILELKEKERVIKEEMKGIRATKKEISDELKDLKEELVEMMDVGEEFEFNEHKFARNDKFSCPVSVKKLDDFMSQNPNIRFEDGVNEYKKEHGGVKKVLKLSKKRKSKKRKRN